MYRTCMYLPYQPWYVPTGDQLGARTDEKWRETPKGLRLGGKKVEIGQTHIFPELQIGQKA